MNRRRFQFTIRMLLLATVLLSLALSLWRWLIHPVNRHNVASERMEVAILSLATKCPPDLTADQWAFCITWTWNLHANYGHFAAISANDLERIADGLQQRVDQGPDLATIDWVWDQYMECCHHAHSYDHWRPTAPENHDAFQAGTHGGNPLRSWQHQHRQRTAPDGKKR